jgi:hypothetical protein
MLEEYIYIYIYVSKKNWPKCPGLEKNIIEPLNIKFWFFLKLDFVLKTGPLLQKKYTIKFSNFVYFNPS